MQTIPKTALGLLAATIVLSAQGSAAKPISPATSLKAPPGMTDLESHFGLTVTPVSGWKYPENWKGDLSQRYIYQGTPLKITNKVTRMRPKIPGDKRKAAVITVLEHLPARGGGTKLHTWQSTVLQASPAGGVAKESHIFVYPLPAGVMPGQYRIAMIVDPQNKIKELNENNNRQQTASFWIRPLARRTR